MVKWATKKAGGLRTVHRKIDIYRGGQKKDMLSKSREQQQSCIKASNPNLFIPKSNITIPTYKAA